MSAKPPTGEDLTGRSRFARNVTFAWGGQVVRIIAGFVIPRMISDRLGVTNLGIWDFTWSIVNFFGLLQLGLSGSVNRYVARYRATGEHEALSRCVSTTGLFLNLSGVLIAVAAVITTVWFLPAFHAELGSDLKSARLIVLFLGADAALSAALSLYLGVIVGCHRSDIHNTLNAISYGGTMLGMMAVLMAGGGLAWLAFVQFFFSTLVNVLRIRIAYRVCPELKVNYGLASWPMFLEQVRFSAKNIIPFAASLVSSQTSSIIIAGTLGPASLAVFMRPRSLVSNIRVLAAKFGMLLIPTASSLQARDDHGALRSTLTESTVRLSFLVLPGVVTLAFLGDSIIRLWMGAEFVYPGLFAVVALGSFASLIQESSWNILVGLNKHGRVSLVQLAGAMVTSALLWFGVVVLEWKLIGAALLLAIPQTIVDGLLTPLAACRYLKVSPREFYTRILVKPLYCVAPYAFFLLIARLNLKTHPPLAMGAIVVGMVVLAATYFRFVLPDAARQKIATKLRLPFLAPRAEARPATIVAGTPETAGKEN